MSKSDLLKFFDAISAASDDKKLNYVVIVPKAEGVFIATNLGDKVIDKLPIDQITAVMMPPDEQLSIIDIEGELH